MLKSGVLTSNPDVYANVAYASAMLVGAVCGIIQSARRGKLRSARSRREGMDCSVGSIRDSIDKVKPARRTLRRRTSSSTKSSLADILIIVALELLGSQAIEVTSLAVQKRLPGAPFVFLRKLLIMGLPGAGKTSLARKIASRLNAVHFNADDIRREINKDLGFSETDRVEHSRRMGWLCDQVTRTGGFSVADFICPTPEARAAFQKEAKAFIVWVDRISASQFEDTNQMFVAPDHYDIRVAREGTVDYWADEVAKRVRPVFDTKRPTALFVGRYQPFHEGHKALIQEGLRRVGQACIAVRDTHQIDTNNPFGFETVRARIEHALREYEGQYVITQVPNISHIFYGRHVGYVVERLDLDGSFHSISATDLRRQLQPPER